MDLRLSARPRTIRHTGHDWRDGACQCLTGYGNEPPSSWPAHLSDYRVRNGPAGSGVEIGSA